MNFATILNLAAGGISFAQNVAAAEAAGTTKKDIAVSAIETLAPAVVPGVTSAEIASAVGLIDSLVALAKAKGILGKTQKQAAAS